MLEFLPIIAFVMVLVFKEGKENLDALRLAFGALAVLATISLAGLVVVARRDPEILIPALMRFQHFLAIPVFFAVYARAPSRKALVIAMAVAAIIVVADVLGLVGALVLGATLAESGRRGEAGDVIMPLVSAAAYAAIAVKAFLSARKALND